MSKVENSTVRDSPETMVSETTQEAVSLEPIYPILKNDPTFNQLRAEGVDSAAQIPAEVSRYLRPEEKVLYVAYPPVRNPDNPLDALQVCALAAGVDSPHLIGENGPTVASVNPLIETGEKSRYETQHGRDDLLAARHLFKTHPKLMRATLLSLAATQGVEDEPYKEGEPHRQEKPGAIILLNRGEDDPIGQKFSRYGFWGSPFYGSVDAPADFVIQMGMMMTIDPSFLLREEYVARDHNTYTASHAFELAVSWLKGKTEENPDGLIEYHNPIKGGGIRNQGWRDSASAMMHADGSWANAAGGIAPIEVQGSAYKAFLTAANIYRDFFKDEETASDLEERALVLRKVVSEQGYVEDEHGGYFVSGFDRDDNGKLRKLQVPTSAMIRMLGTGIIDTNNPDEHYKIEQTIKTLFSPAMYTRWGIRTMSANTAGYVPHSYHIGPVWGHDTNEVATALSELGYYGLDRLVGATTTRQHQKTGVFHEHISGADTADPEIPVRDTYVYNELYDELYLFEQVPPIAQTWFASSEVAKNERYKDLPLLAIDPRLQTLENEIIASVRARYT